MKKAGIILLVLTGLMAAFTGGFFLGRNRNHSDISVRYIQTSQNTTPSGPTEAQLMNINTASAADLATLPGIGKVLGQRIVDYRTEHGPFTKVGDLANIEDIGEKRLEGILEYITVGGTT